MATYYRWRKSEIRWETVNTVEYGIATNLNDNETHYVYFRGRVPQIVEYPEGSGQHFYKVNIDEGGRILVDDGVSQETTNDYYIVGVDENGYGRRAFKGTNLELRGAPTYISVSPLNGTQMEWREAINTPQPGEFVSYVYSTSSSAYPISGVQDGYYYDQRTTVESPTAPTGLTYPNPITTPTVTISWQAATSNTDYPVDHYRVTILPNHVPSMITYTTTSTTQEISIPLTYNNIPVKTVTIRVIAFDTNGQRSSYYDTSNIPVYFAPTLTVPQMVMQGQSATVSWTAIDGADSYTLQRKANTDADWTQVYSGANLSYSETVGTWTSVQYRVQAVFSGTPGGWAESAAIPVVSSSALVISGTDGDLGTVVNDIPYSISTDTGNQITATITVNSAVIFSGNVGNSTSDTIPVLDLVNGEGTIVIEASVTASSGPVSAVRTWTYTKTLITFPNAGSVAQLTKEGENIFPKTLAECVRLPGGGTLDEITGFPAQVYTASYTGTGTYGASNPTQISFPFIPDLWGIVTTGGQGPANLFPWGATSIYGWTNTGYINATCSYSDKTVSISGASAVAQANSSNLEHCFIGIKVGTEAAE